MILGLEIGMLVAGFLALTRGRMELTATLVAEGAAARLLGLLAMTPIPASILVIGLHTVNQCAGKTPREIDAWVAQHRTDLIIIELCVVLGIALLVVGGIAVFGGPPTPPESRPFGDESEPEYPERPAPRGARPVAMPVDAAPPAGSAAKSSDESIVRCPACDGGVRVWELPPDRVVRCQWCGQTFTAPGA